MPRGLGLRDYHQAPVRFEAAVARETILSLSPLLFRLQTPLPVHGRQIASEIVDGVNDRLARMSTRSATASLCRLNSSELDNRKTGNAPEMARIDRQH